MVKVVFFLWKLKPFKGKVEEDLQTKQEIKKKILENKKRKKKEIFRGYVQLDLRRLRDSECNLLEKEINM